VIFFYFFCKIKVYSDLSIAVKLLKEGCPLIHPLHIIVENIHQVHYHKNSVDWIYVLRESNQVADRLAKHGLCLNVEFRIFNVVPSFISLPLWADLACISFLRDF
jgi:hypothetical protein